MFAASLWYISKVPVLPRVAVPEYNPESFAGVLKFPNQYGTKNVPYPEVAAAAPETLNLPNIALPTVGLALKEAASLPARYS